MLIKNADALAVYPRARFRNSRTWNSFVDRHPNGAWWHRQEWIDYSLAYDPSLVDRSFAIVSEGMNYPQVVAICPALERNGLICMGDDPCAGPLVSRDTIGGHTLAPRGYGVLVEMESLSVRLPQHHRRGRRDVRHEVFMLPNGCRAVMG